MRSPLLTQTKTSKKKSGLSLTKIAAYSGAFLLFVSVIAAGYQKPQAIDSQVAAVQNVDGSTGPVTSDQDTPPVDQIIATNVAAGLTEQANLPIAANVANMAVSLSAKNELAQTNDAVISKPQIIQPTKTSRAVTYYTAKRGDTVQSVAVANGISPNTVSWANNLSFDAVAAGKRLTILPTDGVLYTFKSGDSIAGIAKKYNTSKERIISYNDLELRNARPGQQLIIPGGVLPVTERPGYVAPAVTTGGDFGLGGAAINFGFSGISAGNRYAPGNCTWYVYERRTELGLTFGSFWGNASTWDDYARAAGYTVNGTPAMGAVLVDNAGFYGHVAIVEAVRSNGDIVISEMNNFAYGGFNQVDKRVISAGQATAYTYIH